MCQYFIEFTHNLYCERQSRQHRWQVLIAYSSKIAGSHLEHSSLLAVSPWPTCNVSLRVSRCFCGFRSVHLRHFLLILRLGKRVSKTDI